MLTSSLWSHRSHFGKPELQPRLPHGGRMKTALDRRGSLPNSLQLGRKALQQHSSPLTPKFDLPWSLEALREGQDASQLSWGMDGCCTPQNETEMLGSALLSPEAEAGEDASTSCAQEGGC